MPLAFLPAIVGRGILTMVKEVVENGVDTETVLHCGVGNAIDTQSKGQNFKVFGF